MAMIGASLAGVMATFGLETTGMCQGLFRRREKQHAPAPQMPDQSPGTQMNAAMVRRNLRRFYRRH